MKVWLIACLALVACGGAKSGGEGASCVAALRYDGDWYYGAKRVPHLHSGARLTATFPGCNDSNGPREDDSKATVRAVRGIDPHFALLTRDTLWINASTFPQLPSHPLHRLAHAQRHRREGSSCQVRGTASPGGSRDLLVSVNGRAIVVLGGADTVIVRQRAGSGYVPVGDHVVVSGRPCRMGADPPSIEATRIAPA